ncbi:pentatricopeptide repeat-containing protein-like [Dorcoceras hygrometricum]|uniref:Pentatricopeptide repeat-containing protein-like n=1 Tax=Dorcoceras hygrometricum TaxID=472368 RepID=A0A2Z6ZRY6_9LAMI|nr:pentatricopeptide repeat-containing protein-like [Dorcoceras hygrometricum]
MGGGAPPDAMAACARAASRITRDIPACWSNDDAPLLCATMVETLHCWSRALTACWPGGAASLVAREGAIGAFIVRRCWTTMARRWLRCWSTLAGDVARRWLDEATLLDDACGALAARRCARRCALSSRFCGGGAAGRPPLRRNSGDVVTADFF